ncbi:MAG TPA: hypothetical protein VHN20_19150 [Beijerinckiaceae bacterium]|nr:hypothetical protein [Beijerinckiaceae bacterium]
MTAIALRARGRSVRAALVAAGFCVAAGSASADYLPPNMVAYEDLVAATKEVMSRPGVPTKGAEGFVEDVFRINAVGMDWDIGVAVYEPSDPARVAVGADGKKIGIFLLHGGSGDFKSMHPQASVLSQKFGYKVVTMTFPGRHYLQDASREWPGHTVEKDGSVRTPIWVKDELITRDQYDVVEDRTKRPRYGTRRLAQAKPGTLFYYRMAGWPIAFEEGGKEAMRRHFALAEYSIYVHGHSTGGPFVNMLSQRVPNVAGVLAIENSPFGYINRAKHAWSGELGKIKGYQLVESAKQLPSRADPFEELYIRSWRDSARYVGPELLGKEGPQALMRLPMVMEDILDGWDKAQKRPQFKAEYLVTHAIDGSLEKAARVTAERLKLGEADTQALVARYVGLTRELEGPGVKPVPANLFMISAHSRDHSREVYEEVIMPLYRKMNPAPKVALVQFDAGKHGYMSGEDDEGLDLGIGPAVFKVWDEAIKGGWFGNGVANGQ